MKLFEYRDPGDEEILHAVGMISSGITFDKWRPLIPFGIRNLASIVGYDVLEAVSSYYTGIEHNPGMETILSHTQQAVAFFTWLKLIPTLDAQHGDTGRAKSLGENEKGLTALQEFKDEENILRLAYEATDALVEALEREAFPFWTESPKYKQREGLLIRSKEEFDNYYIIGSHRLFVTLVPIIREVQGATVAPVLGKYLTTILSGEDSDTFALMKTTAARAVALLTMQKAVERLPVEVIPEGIVQVQQSQPVKSRLRAEQSARASVAASLGADANRALEYLQQLVAQLDADGQEVDTSITGPIVHSKGMSF